MWHKLFPLVFLAGVSTAYAKPEKEPAPPPANKAAAIGPAAPNAQGTPQAEAARLREEAQAAYRGGDLPAAIVSWKRSYELQPEPEVLVKLGLACWRTGDHVEAMRAYETFLRAVDKDHPLRRQAEKSLLSLTSEYLRSGKAVEKASGEVVPALAATLPAGVDALVREIRANRRRGWLYLGGGAGAAAAITTAVLLATLRPEIPRGDGFTIGERP